MERENQEYISIVNATENNLKHVSLKIPKKKITVFTGVSGSGKSSLCLDTIAAESRAGAECDISKFCPAVSAEIWSSGG